MLKAKKKKINKSLFIQSSQLWILYGGKIVFLSLIACQLPYSRGSPFTRRFISCFQRDTGERESSFSFCLSSAFNLKYSICYCGLFGCAPPRTPTYICLLFSQLKAKLFELTLFTHSELNKGSTINNCFFILSKTSES